MIDCRNGASLLTFNSYSAFVHGCSVPCTAAQLYRYQSVNFAAPVRRCTGTAVQAVNQTVPNVRSNRAESLGETGDQIMPGAVSKTMSWTRKSEGTTP